MLSRDRLYTRREASLDAKLYFIFCEGEKTEPNYFKYFNGIVSQIRLHIVPLNDGKNSPLGLYENACKALLKSGTNPSPQYDLSDTDEVWFVFDTDAWGDEVIDELRAKCSREGWFVAQSNPSFEVWLLYHFQEGMPIFEDHSDARSLKNYLNDNFGGFNSKKHPIFIEKAIVNAKSNFKVINQKPGIHCTEVYLLAERFFPLVKSNIDLATTINEKTLKEWK